MILTDRQIREMMEVGELKIDNFSDDCLSPASYDARIGESAIRTVSIGLKEMKEHRKSELETVNMQKVGSVTIPPGGLALVVTYEKFKLCPKIVGHIGMSTYYVRKGLALLSGLQIDPGFEGALVLSIHNLSSRLVTIDYKRKICTVEFHQLGEEVTKKFERPQISEQKNGKIPTEDRDYFRTFDSMSPKDLRDAILELNQKVDHIEKEIQSIYLPIMLLIIGAFITLFITLIN